jgi:hypothetical protein
MALTTGSNRVVATGDNSTTRFYFNRLLYDATHLQVYLDAALQSSGYTVGGIVDPWTANYVDFAVAPGTGVQVLLLRVVPLTQLSVYAVAGAFPAKTTEKNLDLAMMGLQQFDEILDRAVTLPVESPLTAATIPDPADPANYGMGLKIKGDGTGLDTFLLSATPFTSPLTTKGDICVYSTSADRLPVGANETFLEADSALGLGMKWTSFVSKLFSVLTTKGDLLVSTGATVVRKAIGGAGTIPMVRSADTVGLAYVAALNKAIYGMTYANAAGDVTNDLDIAAGGCMDATGAYWITTSALTKQLDAAWAVGNNAGGLDTGAIGNSDYYIWAIARSDTGVTDYLYSLSSTAPTMPANYDFKRLIGWFKRVGATIVLFTTYETSGGGLELLWSSPTLDINLANTLTTTRRTDAVKVPLNFSVIANLNIRMTDATGLTAIVYCPDQADLVPSATVAPVGNIGDGISGNEATLMLVRTSSTGTIAARATTATIDLYVVATMGFTWARRN